MNPQISAYIPCFNNRETIIRVIQSIQRQTIPVDELFVIDDGSTDDSAQVVKSVGVPVMSHARNLGRGAARHSAIGRARYELVLSCDATNCLDPHFLAKALRWFEDPSVAAVFGRIRRQTADTMLDRWCDRHLFGRDDPVSAVTARQTLLCTYAAVTRKSAVLKVGNFCAALSFGEDKDLGTRLLAAGYDVIYDPECWVSSIDSNSLARVLDRYGRWYAPSPSECNWKQYLRLMVGSVRQMAVRDVRDRDFSSIPLSLFSAHYWFWHAWPRTIWNRMCLQHPRLRRHSPKGVPPTENTGTDQADP
jgi:glycosyltransferase involved in cell wall biosynthesis